METEEIKNEKTDNEPVKTTEDVRRASVDDKQSKTANAKDDSGLGSNVEDIVKKALGSKGKYTNQNDGNITTQYIFNIDRMDGNISSVQKEVPLASASKDVKAYNLQDRKECAEFVAEYKTSLHLAYAIAASLFEYVPVSDLQRFSEGLLRRFPKMHDAEGNEDKTHNNPFLSLDAILGIIGAQTCKVSFNSRFENVTERCVRFENTREKIMENLWESFPMLRSEITGWLIETDFAYSFRNAFSTSCFVKAMFNIVKQDFSDSINRLFPQLVSRVENKYLMIRLMLLLVADSETKKNACEILRDWAKSSKWLWEISLVVYGLADEELPYTEELKKTLTDKIRDILDEDDDWSVHLISGQMINSPRLRSLVSVILNKLADRNKRNNSEYLTAVLYLLIISTAYAFVDDEDVALPLVALDGKKQLENLECLI